MSLPNEVAFALIKYSDMAQSSPVFAALCGITNVSVNETVEVQERRVRDCTTPNKPGGKQTKIIGTNWQISGSGLTNATQRTVIKNSLLGKTVNYKVEYYKDDGTDAGLLLGTESGSAVMTTNNMSLDQNGESSLQIELLGLGTLAYAAAA